MYLATGIIGHMNVYGWLLEGQKELQSAGITTARLDCLVLLSDELERDKSWLLSHPEHDLQGSEIENLNTKIVQRAKHIPLAYLRGHAEFYGREFAVNAHTLVPRPETETIIELVKTLHLPGETRILDVGTGSGCIAITAALELPESRVSACDIDAGCLQTAAANAQKLSATVEFVQSNLLERVKSCDVILANLPYVPDNFQINTAATHEPRHALFGGADGLDLYRQMFDQIKQNTWKPQYILTESLPPQHEVLTDIAKTGAYHLQRTDDFIQLYAAT